MEAKNVCTHHGKTIICLCLEVDCQNKQLCEKCIQTHSMSHSLSYVYLEEIFDGSLLNEIVILDSKLSVNEKLLEEYFFTLQDFFMKKLVESKKSAKERLRDSYCLEGLDKKSLENSLNDIRENGINDGKIDEIRKNLSSHLKFKKKSDQESCSIMSFAIPTKISPAIKKATEFHFESIVDTLVPKSIDQVSLPQIQIKRLISNDNNSSSNQKNFVFDASNIPRPQLSENEKHQRRFQYIEQELTGENGDYYKGQTYNNKYEGFGVLMYSDGSKYEGEFFEGIAYGKGKFIHSDGDIYEGGFFEGKAQGYGVYQHSNGSRYEGMWENDKQNGKGIEVWTDGAKYEGNYFGGKKEGNGVFIWSDGSKYVGNFKDNNIDGFGTYVWADGRRYEGPWVSNKMEGKGEFSWPDGRKYIGEYLADKKHGQGRFIWPDGREYVGPWVNGKQEGEGTYIKADGSRMKGVWVEGKRIKWI